MKSIPNCIKENKAIDGKTGLTLMEIVIVTVIIGILSTLAITHYSSVRERVLNDEATCGLKMLQAAERTYEMDFGTYYPSVGSTAVIADINSNLMVQLSGGPNPAWNYTVYSTGCVKAQRNGGDGRYFHLDITDNGINPGTDGEPDVSDGCP